MDRPCGAMLAPRELTFTTLENSLPTRPLPISKSDVSAFTRITGRAPSSKFIEGIPPGPDGLTATAGGSPLCPGSNEHPERQTFAGFRRLSRWPPPRPPARCWPASNPRPRGPRSTCSLRLMPDEPCCWARMAREHGEPLVRPAPHPGHTLLTATLAHLRERCSRPA